MALLVNYTLLWSRVSGSRTMVMAGVLCRLLVINGHNPEAAALNVDQDSIHVALLAITAS